MRRLIFLGLPTVEDQSVTLFFEFFQCLPDDLDRRRPNARMLVVKKVMSRQVRAVQ